MRGYLLVAFAVLCACSTVRPINAAAHAGLCNDEGEECCDTPGVCDSSQGLGCSSVTNTCVFIENGGSCDDPGEPCCVNGCDTDTHLECDMTRGICVTRALDPAECGDFGEPCCPTVEPDASTESMTGCLEGMTCRAVDHGTREDMICMWTGTGSSQVDVGFACVDGVCREEDLMCHPVSHACVLVSNPTAACSSWGAPCCDSAEGCHGARLQCFHGYCTHSPFES